ncbi:Heparinase II/III-like protein [Cyclobacterium lianum]|uniref:Heparinase II/III-like protein n=1 Tax=Cyclobacterium lianum TaxID=388280 RepID=A0A1M7NFY5_9BACT|nr:alginate lyase family protein [Cyclobacterium lianum]SHN02543.1 Heparinase II/III-like protein [Cyclobacterium lianum]
MCINSKPKKCLLILFITLIAVIKVSAQKNWQAIQTAEDLYQAYPETVRGIFDHLDLSRSGLNMVEAAVAQDKWVEAAEKLLDYYENSANGLSLRKELPASPTSQRVAAADTILQDIFTIQNVRGKVPVLPDGHRDWYYKGPNNDREWAWLSNRHSQLMQVMHAYFETGNPRYAEYMDLFLRDFIIKSMPYPGEKGTGSIWRGLEVAARAKAWSRVFYGMLDSEYLSPATRLLILSSLPDHAHYSRNFHGGNNWLTMEISALATIAAYFPEFKKSDEWLDYAVESMVESMKDQVYPDGVQTELASHYHNVSMHNFELFQSLCKEAGRELPDYFTSTIKDMYAYIAHAVRPDGHRLLNNDGDRGSDRELILQGAEKFNQADWIFIATNGEKGSAPESGPSYFFPWAGHLISRSGFDPEAHWSFFDVGPWGSGHQHNDKLHLSLAAFGKDFLVDAGRFAYTGAVAEKFRPYARSSRGHNLLLIDDKGQLPGPTHAVEALDQKYVKIAADFDYASQSFDQFEGMESQVTHIRSLFYVRDEFWVVVDRVLTGQARKLTALWHWHPDITLSQNEKMVTGEQGGDKLSIVPVGNQRDHEVRMIRGQEEPDIQGWYSPEYNLYEPNSVSAYEIATNNSKNLVWLLVPHRGDESLPDARILSENENRVKLEIVRENQKWQLTIPFLNSYAAELENIE